MSELKKRPSVTEDLKIKTIATPNSAINKSLKEVQENHESNENSPISPTTGIIPTAKPAVSSNGPTSAVNSVKRQNEKTLGEMTQDIKAQLSKASEEIERADAEFQRLLGNLEKKVAALRVNLNASK